jgi:hypothetical protein
LFGNPCRTALFCNDIRHYLLCPENQNSSHF